MDSNLESRQQPQVLVLLAAYNGADLIERQIRSIFSQEEIAVHIIVSVDKSTDDTVVVVNKLKVDQGANLLVWNTGQRYGSAGENFKALIRNAETANFDYIAFSDQDDIWWPSKLRKAVCAIQDSGCRGYSSSVEANWEDGKRRTLKQSNRFTSFDFLFEGAGQGCTYVFEREAFEDLQQVFRSSAAELKLFHHDWLSYLIIKNLGYQWYFDQQASMSYMQSNQNETGARQSRAGVAHRVKLIKSGWYKEQIGHAIACADMLGNTSYHFEQVKNIFNANDTARRRILLCFISLRHGRRKFTDRIFVSFLALLGFI